MAWPLLHPGNSYRVQAMVTNLGRSATFTVEWRAGLLKRPLLPTPCESIGDINGDGVINILDLIKINRIVLEQDIPTPEELWRADLDGNGVVNILELILLERYILEADTTFPVCALPPPAGHATLTLLDFFTTEPFAPGEQRLLTQWFTLPRILVEDMGIAQVIVLAEGQQLAKASAILEVAPAQPIYPLDDWTLATQTNGQQAEFRETSLPVGWAGGLQMAKVEGVIQFLGLRTDITKATLILTPTEYFGLLPGDDTIVLVNLQAADRDKQIDLMPLRIDVTRFVQANTFGDGSLLVELSPTPVGAVARNWTRRYGSVRGVADVRPRIEITL